MSRDSSYSTSADGSTVPGELLTLDEIADLWRIKREKARRHLVRLPEFPDPAPGSTRKHKLWRASDIQAFLSQEPAGMPAKV